jgi:hypothetical protein
VHRARHLDVDREVALTSPAAKERIASCGCGSLKVTLRGEPSDVYVCACQSCQQKSGGAFTYAAIFPKADAVITGEYKGWRRIGESGRWIEYNFCPTCGYTVFFSGEGFGDGLIGIPVGGLSDQEFAKPARAYWTSRRHRWLELPADIPHIDTQ